MMTRSVTTFGRLLMIGAVLLTGLAVAQAQADDFAPPPWTRGAPLSTACEWEFLTDANGHIDPDGTSVTTVGGTYGISDVSIYSTPGNDPAWSIGDGDGQWTATTAPAYLGFQLENWLDDQPIKYLRLQVTFNGDLPVITSVSGIHQTEQVIETPTGVTLLDANHALYEYELTPNPFFEILELQFEPGTSIDQVIVDTISIPEPASLTLFGLAGLAMRRRTRHGR